MDGMIFLVKLNPTAFQSTVAQSRLTAGIETLRLVVVVENPGIVRNIIIGIPALPRIHQRIHVT